MSMMTFDDWYGVDIALRGSPRPIAKAAWEDGVAEGIRREREARPPLAPEHVEALKNLAGLVEESKGVFGFHLNGDAAPWEEFDEDFAAAIRAALAALGEPEI